MDKIVNYVYETCDYDKFRFIKGNREIDHDRNIAVSMGEDFLFSPITVNEKMEIIDGQNRFMAAKSLGRPVYYIIKAGYGVKEVRTLNSNSRNWKKKDFIRSFAEEGKEEYVKIVRFMETYPDFPASLAEMILRMSSSITHDKTGKDGRPGHEPMKRGLFRIKNLEESERIARMLMAYKPYHKDIYKRRSFVAAMIRLSRDPQFDNGEVIRKIRLDPRSFVPCVDANEYIRMIEDIVNYRRKGEKIRFNV